MQVLLGLVLAVFIMMPRHQLMAADNNLAPQCRNKSLREFNWEQISKDYNKAEANKSSIRKDKNNESKSSVSSQIVNGSNAYSEAVNDIFTSAYDYWKPTLDQAAVGSAEVLKNYVQPAAQTIYKAIYNSIGRPIAEQFYLAMQKIEPNIKSATQQAHQELKDMRNNSDALYHTAPAAAKKLYEKMILGIWKSTQATMSSSQEIPKEFHGAIAIASAAAAAMQADEQSLDQQRVRYLVDMLRPYAEDPDMRSCYTGWVMDPPTKNAINTGCNIFVSRQFLDELNDQELLAILAHEMSHGDQGHSIKNIGYLMTTYGAHFVHLLAEEISWFFTGVMLPYNSQVLDVGNRAVILKNFGKYGPQQEIAADRGGVRILNSMGISGKVMEKALLKIHGLTEEQISAQDPDKDGVRDYPSAYKRLTAIKAESCF